jgi:gas vesicle protein
MSDEYDRDSGASSVILSFLLGGLAGAALALLYAPQSGEETREMLSDKLKEGEMRARELRERAVQRSRQALDDATSYVERQKETIEQRKERLTAAVEAGRQAFREEQQKS